MTLSAHTATAARRAQARASGAHVRAGVRPRAQRHRRVKGPIAHASIIGGQLAQAGTFRWMAYVIDQRREALGQCTGTVVAANLILTAAHCAENTETGVVNEPSGYTVV